MVCKETNLLGIVLNPEIRALAPVANADSREFPGGLVSVVKDMIGTMYQHRGIGLAAPQVGLSIPLFVCELETPEGLRPRAFWDPSFEPATATLIESQEGCLSLPGAFIPVARYETIVFQAREILAEPPPDGLFISVKETLTGRNAAVVQHEIDHLNGILMIDHLKPLQRQMVLKKLNRRKSADLVRNHAGGDGI